MFVDACFISSNSFRGSLWPQADDLATAAGRRSIKLNGFEGQVPITGRDGEHIKIHKVNLS